MDKTNKKQVEFYAVVALVIVAAIVAYFRFFRRPTGAPRVDSDDAIAESTLEIPELPGWVADGAVVASQERPAYTPPPRDLFARAIVKETSSGEPDPVRRSPDGLPVLTGTMQGKGGRVLAIVNGQIIGVGGKVDGYTVTRIKEGEVVLERGDKRKVVKPTP
jgi:hypothetical protein